MGMNMVQPQILMGYNPVIIGTVAVPSPVQLVSHTETNNGLFGHKVTDRDNYGTQTSTTDDGFGKTTTITNFADGSMEIKTSDTFGTKTIQRQINGEEVITETNSFGTKITTKDAYGNQRVTRL